MLKKLIKMRSMFKTTSVNRIICFSVIYISIGILVILWAVFYQNIIQFCQLVISNDASTVYDNGYLYGILFVLILLAQYLAGYLVEKLNSGEILKITILLLSIMLFFSFIDNIYTKSIFIIMLFLNYKFISSVL